MPYMADDFRFKVMGELGGERPRTIARFTCDTCTAVHDQYIHSGKALNPEMIAKHARRHGWHVPARRAGKIICPACQKIRAEKARGESPGKIAPLPLPPAAPPAMPPTIHSPLQQEMPMPPAPATLKPSITELTPDQKVKVRSFLDRHFDDAVGSYLDGWSDQKIGEEVNVPWSLVAKLRDVAYGPIRVDPEIVGLRAQISDVERKLKEQRATWEKALSAADHEIAGLKAQLAALERKRAA